MKEQKKPVNYGWSRKYIALTDISMGESGYLFSNKLFTMVLEAIGGVPVITESAETPDVYLLPKCTIAVVYGFDHMKLKSFTEDNIEKTVKMIQKELDRDTEYYKHYKIVDALPQYFKHFLTPDDKRLLEEQYRQLFPEK